jgi:hypothetical protein
VEDILSGESDSEPEEPPAAEDRTSSASSEEDSLRHTQPLHVMSASSFSLPTSSDTKNALEKRSFSVNIDTASYCPVSLQRGGQPRAHTQPLHVQSASSFSCLQVPIRKMLLKRDPFQLILIQPLIVQSASSEEDSLRHTHSLFMSSQPPVFPAYKI